MGGSSGPHQWIQPETLPVFAGKGEEGQKGKGRKDEGRVGGMEVWE